MDTRDSIYPGGAAVEGKRYASTVVIVIIRSSVRNSFSLGALAAVRVGW